MHKSRLVEDTHFFGGYVRDIRMIKPDPNNAYVESKCWASQKIKHTKYCQKIVVQYINVSEAEDLEDKSVDSDSEKAGNKSRKYHLRIRAPNIGDLPLLNACHALLVSTAGTVSMFFALLAVGTYAGRTALLPGGQSITSAKKQWGPRTRDVEPKRVISSVVE